MKEGNNEINQSHTQSNKRIAKNTMMLYVRMLLTMGVSLYTSRVVLEALGVEDYGVYNVVGGMVSMFTMISGSLSNAISRFITYEIGKGNKARLKLIFSTSIIIQLIFSVIIIVLIETVGVWFLNNEMNIPQESMQAARWVLQFSMLALVVNLLSIPYNALIIANEKMFAFAYVSILEAFGKLSIAYLIMISPMHRLVFYALLMFVLSLIVRLVYGFYCKVKFEEAKNIMFSFDKDLFKEMFGFAGWNFIGSSAGMLKNQGVNIMLNVFFGPVVNAARGIAMQVNTALNRFVGNFMIALNPQITKSYASGDKKYMMQLIYKGAKYSYFLLFMLSLPILFETKQILSLWLVDVPDHTVSFVRLILIDTLITALVNPLVTAQLATGNIKTYQIVVGGIHMLNLPFAYFCLKLELPVESVLYVAIILSIICLFARLYFLRYMISLSIREFFYNVIFKITIVSIITIVLPFVLYYRFPETIFRLIVIIVLGTIVLASVIYFIGIDVEEKAVVKKVISKFKIKKI